jgi:hypothetical protein
LQIFKLLFFEHYASFVKLGAPSGWYYGLTQVQFS